MKLRDQLFKALDAPNILWRKREAALNIL